MPNFVRSTAGAAPFALKPWHRPPIQQRKYTIPIRRRDTIVNYAEVPMSKADGSATYRLPALNIGDNDDFCFWTAHASGGCTPFAVIVRHPVNRAVAESMALAHLMYDPFVEARDMGSMFSGVAIRHDVYLVIMKFRMSPDNKEELRYLTEFETGFGQQLPDQNKTLLTTLSVHAAINMEGYFGEISNAQQGILNGANYTPLQAAEPVPTVWR